MRATTLIGLAIVLLVMAAGHAQDGVKCLTPDGSEESCAARQAPATALSKIAPIGNILPPIEIDYPFAGELTIKHFHPADQQKHCPNTPTTAIGCTFPYSAEYCTIYVPYDAEERLARVGHVFSDYMRHEIGHCNAAAHGWADRWTDHKGMRPAGSPPGKAPNS